MRLMRLRFLLARRADHKSCWVCSASQQFAGVCGEAHVHGYHYVFVTQTGRLKGGFNWLLGGYGYRLQLATHRPCVAAQLAMH